MSARVPVRVFAGMTGKDVYRFMHVHRYAPPAAPVRVQDGSGYLALLRKFAALLKKT
jgi:hypothetical protein